MRDKKNAPREVPIRFEDANEDLQSDTPPQMDLAAGGGDDDQANLKASRHEDDAFDPPLEPEPVSGLQTQVDSLAAERASLYDQLLRRQAEFENYRKRVERERSVLYQRGRDDVLLQFLPVVDNFERALESLESSEGDAEALRHGVELIHKQFKDALSKFGLEPVESVGQTFDPHLHEAVTTEPSDKHKENTIIEEFQRGYRIGNKLLRPAKVKVASSPEK
jgi:molecular chaperone GrpE